MEYCIKNNVNDITYMSELTPPFWQWQFIYMNLAKRAGLIRTITYSHFRVRKLCAH